MDNKKALLTGVTGFIGSHLARHLLKNNWEVNAIVRESSNLDVLPPDIKQNINFHVHTNQNSLLKIVKTSAPDVVFHLASLFLSNHKYEDIPALIESNVTFGTQLLDAMIKNDVKNLVNTGTSWQHYENKSYSPVNLYAATKQAFEDITKYYIETAGLHVINLQLFDTYGEGDRRRKLLSLLREIADSGETLQMSLGEQKIDIVHVDDVADAFLIAANFLLNEQYEFCDTYAISSGNAISLRDLVKKYEQILGKKLNIEWGKRAYREREVMIPWNTGKLLPTWLRKHTELM